MLLCKFVATLMRNDLENNRFLIKKGGNQDVQSGL